MEQTNKPADFKIRLNYLTIIISLIIMIVVAIGLSIFIDRSIKFLRDFIVNTLQINQYYVERLIGFFFFACSSVLVLLAALVDGERGRIRSLLKGYSSKLVVKDYYNEEDAEDGKVATSPPDASSRDRRGDEEVSLRAKASVRPNPSAIEDSYKQGRIDGTFKEFYPNGQLKREVRYQGGKMDGKLLNYYENGQIEQEGFYKNGILEGVYKAFYEDGTLHQDKFYVKGKLYGVYTAFDEKGIPFFEITYKDGLQHGTDKIYDQHGVMQFMDTYFDGILVNRKTYDEYGELKFDQYFEDGIAQAEEKEAGEHPEARLEKEKKKRKKPKE